MSDLVVLGVGLAGFVLGLFIGYAGGRRSGVDDSLRALDEVLAEGQYRLVKR